MAEWSGLILLALIGLVGVAKGKQESSKFRVIPKDVAFYYGQSRQMVQFCVPQKSSSSTYVMWLKNTENVEHNKRTTMTTMPKRKVLALYTDPSLRAQLHSLANDTLVHILKIDPVTTADSGKYSCVEPGLDRETETSFTVSVSALCPGSQFKCTADQFCIARGLVCDGIAHCRDRADENANAGCGRPDVPLNIHLQWRKYNALSLKWDEMDMVVTYDLRVIHPDGREDAYLVDSRYAGHAVYGLENGTTYSVKIRSKSMAGYSLFSPLINFTTLQLEAPGKPDNLTGSFDNENRSSFSLRWRTPTNLANHPKKGISYRIRSCVIERETYTVTIPPTTKRTTTTTQTPSITTEATSKVTISDNKTITTDNADSTDNITKSITKTINPTTDVERATNVQDSDDIGAATTEETPSSSIKNRGRRADPASDSSEADDIQSVESTGNTTNATAPPPTRTIVIFKLVNCSEIEDISDNSYVLDNLTANSNYYIEVTSIGLKGVIGRSDTMNITTIIPTAAPTTEAPAPGGEISGVLIFSFVTGGLVGLLIIMFILAYIMKWPLVIKGSNDPLSEHNKRKSEAPLDHNYEKL